MNRLNEGLLWPFIFDIATPQNSLAGRVGWLVQNKKFVVNYILDKKKHKPQPLPWDVLNEMVVCQKWESAGVDLDLIIIFV